MTEPTDPSGRVRRASLTIAGKSLARHQVDIALALRCQLIVCVVEEASPELTLLRADAENAGARLEIARDAIELRGFCAPSDELLVVADGLLADPEVGVELLGGGPAVLVQPAELGLPLGFERLDLTRAVGGMMLVPAGLLAELPDGYDVPSGLTRVALQAGVPTRELPANASLRGAWRLVRSETEAQAIDDQRIAANIGSGGSAGPSDALARFGVRAYGATLLHSGSRRILLLGGILLLLIALSAGWLGATVLAFAIIALSSVVGQAGLLLLRIEHGAATSQVAPRRLAAAFDALIDTVLLSLMIWASPALPNQLLSGRAFAPLMLIGIVRLGSQLFPPRLARLLADRAVVALALLTAAAMHVLPTSIEAFALLLAFGASIHLSLGNVPRR